MVTVTKLTQSELQWLQEVLANHDFVVHEFALYGFFKGKNVEKLLIFSYKVRNFNPQMLFKIKMYIRILEKISSQK